MFWPAGRLLEFVTGIGEIPATGDAITEALAAHARLGALIAASIGEFDAASLWELDDAVSMAQWLVTRGGRSRKEAARLSATARRLRQLPATRRAYVDGLLTPGQVDTITAQVGDAAVELFAEQEAEVIATLIGLDSRDTARAMTYWKQRADALIDSGPPVDEEQSLHLSRVGEQLVVDATLTGLGAAYVENAIRVASSNDLSLSPAQRRADGLVTIAKFYLDRQQTGSGGRHRPHVNVIIQPDGNGSLLNGAPLDRTTTEVLCCDAAFHRVLLDAASVDLDYGRATRNIPPSLYTSLVIRDGGCRFPGCDRGIETCDVHHVHWWEHGGHTAPDNTALMCLRHHQKLHEPGWHAKLLPNAELHVTRPDGTELSSTPRGG